MGHVTILTALVCIGLAGCVKHPPTNSMKASGTLVSKDGVGDLTVVFTPPDKFRIVGSHPLAGKIVDIGGDGDVIWVVTGDTTTVMKGKIIIDDHGTWEPNRKTYIPPKAATSAQ